MGIEIILLVCFVFTTAIFWYKWYISKKLILKTQEDLTTKIKDFEKLLGQKKSSEIVTGQITEKLVPFLDCFKYNPRDAIFIGMPIDYIVMAENEIVFIEVKTGRSQLTQKQKKIKSLVDNKQIKWETIRI